MKREVSIGQIPISRPLDCIDLSSLGRMCCIIGYNYQCLALVIFLKSIAKKGHETLLEGHASDATLRYLGWKTQFWYEAYQHCCL